MDEVAEPQISDLDGEPTSAAGPSLADDAALTGELEADLAAIEAELEALETTPTP